MKKIGFVDYYLSEWHANNDPAWFAEVAPDYQIAYAWAEKDVSPRDGVTSAETAVVLDALPSTSGS